MERFTACFAERLVLHTAAYWLMLTVRDAIATPHPLAIAEFTTLQNRSRVGDATRHGQGAGTMHRRHWPAPEKNVFTLT
jgi:hypothetical protein